MRVLKFFSLWLCASVIILSGVGYLYTQTLFKDPLPTKIANASTVSKNAFPFRGGEMWNAEYLYGYKENKWGVEFDFIKPAAFDGVVISPTSGIISRICTAGEGTSLRLEASNGDTFRFQTLVSKTAAVSAGERKVVNQGDYLGAIIKGGEYKNTDSKTGDCNLNSITDRLSFHWTLKNCPAVIEGYTFDCSDKKWCIDQKSYQERCVQRYANFGFMSSNGLSLLSTHNKQLTSFLDSTFQIGSKNNSELGLIPLVLKQKNTIDDEGWVYNSLSQEIRGPNDACADAGNVSDITNRWLRVGVCAGSPNQKWVLDNQHRLWSRADSKLCIDSALGNTQDSVIRMQPCSDSINQQWNLVSSEAKP